MSYSSMTDDIKDELNKRVNTVVRKARAKVLALPHLTIPEPEDDKPAWMARPLVGSRGKRATWLSRGGYVEASSAYAESGVIREDWFEVPRDTIGFHMSELEEKIIDPGYNWDQLAVAAGDKMVSDLKSRAKVLSEAVGVDDVFGDPRLTFVVWDYFPHKWFIEPDNWFLHILAKADIGAVFMQDPREELVMSGGSESDGSA